MHVRYYRSRILLLGGICSMFRVVKLEVRFISYMDWWLERNMQRDPCEKISMPESILEIEERVEKIMGIKIHGCFAAAKMLWC